MSKFQQVTRQEVASHNTPKNAWIIIDSLVYDITNFAALHPGGEHIILEVAGKDATKEFYSFHRHEVLAKYPRILIGGIVNEKPQIVVGTSDISKVPYGEPSYMQGFHSAYFNDSHRKFQQAVRKFVREEIAPEGSVFENMDKPASVETFKKMGQFGYLASRIGPGEHLKAFTLPGGVKPEEFDYFHEMITHEEISALSMRGYTESLGSGMVIGLPPVIYFGSDSLKQKVIGPVLRGEKRICLSITEPGAGSDVAAIKATAVKTPDGKFYIVNGTKKWITNGAQSDYFSTAVRTGDGPGGISMLLVERADGLETKTIKTSYSSSAGTSYVIMENLKVPVENLLGKEGDGFQVIMYNFNHERWVIACSILRSSRVVVEECFKWSHQRMVFGKRLIDQPVIRNKLAHMIAEVEATQNWLENITYQMNKMSYKDQANKLAGPIALLKLQCTRVAHNISDQACQIFGGRGITKTGMGHIIESFQRTYKFAAILGGSEEIMADLGVRQAMRMFPKNARL
ncbi:hypothetical protein BATDEDRAFT_91934 [Batrachochytrium dendrobatidis JAM81]|uniref:Cytochrome b5 heme-binding domain-containing protein n=1 Tax=Batrachochytrium dendrobatidis (strain JAM81 / FGSC 10211) TaxID=684364 RepID=F4PBZ5_BATDJ|nr:uncharacterized protein BATDEDRAFT_91934 [Batrachochytrium dendrobatidis JAM81]EGF77101.1 hypothetical protein BATDEDRAFT_91934 [Batrachochytrium dendrobatidis JAM81]KAJ8330457.1 hypothetical protein O5D80_001443 [Batrachochytrium dendrobatidis]KAJ8330465.1 hypothetical protein O5D80_001450 [Batrachochytrium dendrobatidis]KAK5665446.1 hypothetical protein QVD99_007794 [Batrachochytrium dendrobatidis]|eukprot:XP_006682275.1 hypothetical protein BATDEDRAFT_91934 [Batrachochytrium dendrobatidis JAM81]